MLKAQLYARGEQASELGKRASEERALKGTSQKGEHITCRPPRLVCRLCSMTFRAVLMALLMYCKSVTAPTSMRVYTAHMTVSADALMRQ